ncbi:MAG TPA: matrixin family metalloprotease [Terriglobales bacterium]|nr:matrixin family metalloprotease [Terriglobales bacterium]
MNRISFALAAICLIALAVTPGYSWLSQFTGGPNNVDRWDFTAFPVVWNLNPATGSNVTGNRSVHDVMVASFATWTTAPNAALGVNEGANSGVGSQEASPSNENLICFVCTDADFTQDSSTLAITITTTANNAGESDGHGGTSRFGGQIIKSDILFNPKVQYTTGGTDGENLQVIATHEIGHFFGLDHSGVVRAIMFPFAGSTTTLSYDDVAGISTVYPSASQQFAPGSISGRIAFTNGGGVFGAHVFAESTTSNLPIGGNIRKSPISTLTAPDGTYTIRGIPADTYNVTAEPLDDPVTKSDVDTYPGVFGQSTLQTNFTTRWRQ